MKYRATCPGCGTKFPRAFYHKRLRIRRCCVSCGCYYTGNFWWETIGNAVLGVLGATFALLAIFGVMTWFVAAPLILAVYIAGYIFFPYITVFDLVQGTKTHENTSA